MLAALQNFFNVFGATIVVPVMIFMVSLFLKVSPKRAFFSALRAGVGLTGFGCMNMHVSVRHLCAL